eukprot:119579-Hanusia_phi.AAC.1
MDMGDLDAILSRSPATSKFMMTRVGMCLDLRRRQVTAPDRTRRPVVLPMWHRQLQQPSCR